MVVAQVACPYDARSVNRVAQCMYYVWQVTQGPKGHIAYLCNNRRDQISLLES